MTKSYSKISRLIFDGKDYGILISVFYSEIYS